MAYSRPKFKEKYGNFIGGEWVAPVNGKYFDNTSPIDNSLIAKMPRSDKDDVSLALDAAHAAAPAWGKTSVTERSLILNKIANVIEANSELLAVVETCENGKPIRETINADLPLAIDHFRYFASVIRAEAGDVADLNENTVSMEIHEPLGVVAQIIPWNFPLLMAIWKLAPALAAGNCSVLKPAEQTPTSICVLLELIQDILPKGVVNVIHGFGLEAGKPLADSGRVAKVAFTGETTTGRLIMQYASNSIIPVTLELGGKSPNIFMPSVCAKDDEFFDKAVEGFVMFALNKGEVCTCPSRALVHESIYDEFMERAIARTKAIVIDDPYDINTMMGAQASSEQYEKIRNYLSIGKEEGAEVLAGGDIAKVDAYPDGLYIQPTIFKGHNKMRVFQEEIFGPIVSVTTFKTQEEALEIANDTLYGLGAGVWTRDVHEMQYFQRGIEAGRIWSNCYHDYSAHASFGGYKLSGIGRETHKMMLNHYRHVKNVLTSYDKNKLGFF